MASLIPRKILNSHRALYLTYSVYKTKFPSLINTRQHSDGMMPTTLSRLDVGSKEPLISAYSVQGFTLHGVKAMGSVALLPKGFFHWNIKSVEDITPESLVLFTMCDPALELVIIGTGSKLVPIDVTIKRYLQEKGISVEIQDTPNACATFNFLLNDRRLAGAALIPPETIN